ncbi:hypothetical protein [Stieleria varia]|nr:hypothetical protein [Stieleria varia]
MRYNPMVASRRYGAAREDDRTMRWTEATHRADEHGNHNGVARSTPPFCRYSAQWMRYDAVIGASKELDDVGVDNGMLTSAARSLVDRIRDDRSAIEPVLKPLLPLERV